MSINVSAIINTINEEKNIERAIRSVNSFADEIIICDMYSTDNTVAIAKKLGAKVVLHKPTRYVEPARNFAISKASHEWILILDADEEIPTSLESRIKEMLSKPIVSDFVEIPRKNIIFGKWIRASMWWPDYHVRLFRKGKVMWNDQIHSKPQTQGQGITLPAQEELAIIHHNYQTISQFVERMNRYSSIQAQELQKQRAPFKWTDLISKPLDEFLSRFFAEKGYLDGLHGLTLSLLQATSFLLVYLKLWEASKFREEEISLDEIKAENEKSCGALNYWFNYSKSSNNLFKKFLKKIRKRD